MGPAGTAPVTYAPTGGTGGGGISDPYYIAPEPPVGYGESGAGGEPGHAEDTALTLEVMPGGAGGLPNVPAATAASGGAETQPGGMGGVGGSNG